MGRPDAIELTSPRPTRLPLSALTIRSAMFGAGDHLADVTPRVIELLGRKPSGFTANAQSLGAEPWPGKKKHLTIRYEYQGADCVLTVPGQKKLTYQALVQHACRQEPATSP